MYATTCLTNNVLPPKGAKSNTTKFSEKRYGKVVPPIICTTMTDGWIPDAVNLEGMFLINITPCSVHKTMGDYAEFLLKQHILPYYRTETEVHVLFDDPDCQKLSPKYFERKNRDASNKVPDDHCYGDFSPDLMIHGEKMLSIVEHANATSCAFYHSTF